MTVRFQAGPDDEGERLDVALSGWLAESRNQASNRIERGEVRVDGQVASKSHRLTPGEAVEVAPPPAPPTGADGVAPPPVRYEDEHLLIVAKPAGMVVHPGVGNPAGTMVQALVAAGYDLAAVAGDRRPGIVHRLDKDTSGLLVVARSDEAYRGLVRALKARNVDRTYLALAEGELPGATGRIEVPIGRDPSDRKRFAAVPDGKRAVTHWEILGNGRVDTGPDEVPVSRVRCRLETGRTHQIRVHLSYAGHPVVGDRTYGARRDVARALGVDRPALHAAELAFDHPITGERVALEEPLPDDLGRAFGRIRTDRSRG